MNKFYYLIVATIINAITVEVYWLLITFILTRWVLNAPNIHTTGLAGAGIIMVVMISAYAIAFLLTALNFFLIQFSISRWELGFLQMERQWAWFLISLPCTAALFYLINQVGATFF